MVGHAVSVSAPALAQPGQTVHLHGGVYSAQTGGTRLYSKMLLTGYNGYFVKINVIWSIGDKVTTVDAAQALNSFIPALMR